MADSHSNSHANISDRCNSNDTVYLPKHDKDSSEVNNPENGWESHLLSLCEERLTNPADLLAATLFLFLIESGFVPLATENTNLDDDRTSCENITKTGEHKLPKDWKTSRPGSYFVQFILPECSQYSCQIVAVPLSDLLLINAVSKEPDVTFSVCLATQRYISFSDVSTKFVFSKRKELLIKFKDAIISPTRSAALSYRGIASASLTGLPKEILIRILILSGPFAVCRLACTSRYMSIIARDQIVWHHFFKQNFDSSSTMPLSLDSSDWLELYKDKFKNLTTPKKRSFDLMNYYLYSYRNIFHNWIEF